MFNHIASTYDFLNHILSFGVDIYWRKILIKNLPQNSQKIIDIATGTGDLALAMANEKKVQKITAVDPSTEMLKGAKIKAKKLNKENIIEFIEAPGEKLPFADNSFDVATISFGIRNFNNPHIGLMEIKRVLKENGTLLILEFSIPKNVFIKFFYLLYFRYLLPFIGGIISKNKKAYNYLNETVEEFPYGEAFLKVLKEANFEQASFRPLSFGLSTLYTAKSSLN